ncbi:MAG: hypothetical protein ACM31O_05015 [Bacteroidota bacterium]
MQKSAKDKRRLGWKNRYPSDGGSGDGDDKSSSAKDKSWTPGDKGRGREGFSKGYGGSGGKGTGPSGPERK